MGSGTSSSSQRPVRADAQRNSAAVVAAAKAVFAASGVDAPVREVAARAGVGTATIYRHFPQRSDLVAAVFRQEVDACAEAGPALAGEHAPGRALEEWLRRYSTFVATKRGLGAALHSGDPVFDALPRYFTARLAPTLQALLDAAAASGEVRAGVDAGDLLIAVSRLCTPGHGSVDESQSSRLLSLLVDGLRHGAGSPDRRETEG